MTNFPTSLEPLYCALGKVALAWSYLENIIDICTDIVYHVYDGKSLAHKDEMPRSLKNKLEFLKKSFKTISQLGPFKIEGLQLLDELAELSIVRHDMMHSIYSYEVDKGYLFTKYNYKKESHEIQDHKFTINDYCYYGNRMMDLANEFEKLASRLHYWKAKS